MNERLLNICIKANIKTWSFNEVGFISLYESELEKFAVLVEAAARADEREQIAAWYEAEGQMIFPVAIPKIIRARGTT